MHSLHVDSLTISLGLIFAWTTIVSAADMASTDISPGESIVIPGIDKSNTVQSTVERRMLIVFLRPIISGQIKIWWGPSMTDGTCKRPWKMLHLTDLGSMLPWRLINKSGMLDHIASVYAGADADDISYFLYRTWLYPK